MKIPMKLYLIVFVCATILFVQYHIYAPYMQNDYIYDRKTPCEAILSKVPPDLPPLYIITPTYRRPEQLPELTRLSHTLMLVPNLVWLVIEDAYGTNNLVEDILKRSGIRYHYFIAPMPVQYKNITKGPRPRGVSNRNKGLEWVRENAYNGVLYFADDDNTYDLDLFSEIRNTKRVSMFPVGLITKAGVSSPIVRNGTFRGFYDGWIGGRKFAVDMAGFALSVQFLLSRPGASMPYKPGFEEDGFLKSLAPFEPHEVELLASNCTRMLKIECFSGLQLCWQANFSSVKQRAQKRITRLPTADSQSAACYSTEETREALGCLKKLSDLSTRAMKMGF